MPTPEHLAALRQGANVAAIAGAIMKVHPQDRLDAACGCNTIAEIIVRHDPAGRTALAREMIAAAFRLDPDVRLGLDA